MRVRNGFLLLLVLIGLAVSSCGDDSEDTADPETSTTPPAATGTTSDVQADPSAGDCIEAWNASPNGNAQDELEEAFGGGQFGNILVGSEDGACVLTYGQEGEPNVVVYRLAGDAFERAEDLPADQYQDYRETIDGDDVVLEPKGKIRLVS